jgi:hypothetical protein
MSYVAACPAVLQRFGTMSTCLSPLSIFQLKTHGDSCDVHNNTMMKRASELAGCRYITPPYWSLSFSFLHHTPLPLWTKRHKDLVNVSPAVL